MLPKKNCGNKLESIVEDFFITSDYRPFTLNTHHLIASEIERLDQTLAPLGIEQTRVGMEFEFNLPETPMINTEYWQKVKNNIIKGLHKKITCCNNAKRRNMLENKLNIITTFIAREILMYDLIEYDVKTKMILEPFFGQGRYGDGYYDVGNMLEIRIRHCDIKEMQNKRNIVLQTLYDKCGQFGLPLEQPPHQHMHFSFWKDGKNLFDPEHPEFITIGKTIVEGLTRVLYDVHPILISRNAITTHQPFALPANRDNLVRSATGRYEVRFNRYTNQHPDLILPVVLAGALFSLTSKDECYFNENVKRAIVSQKITVYHHPDKYNFVTDVLNTTVNPDGSLDIPENYIAKKIQYIVPELIKDYTCNDIDMMEIIRFFKGVRIHPKGETYEIIWPVNKQPNLYKIVSLDERCIFIDISLLKKDIQFGTIQKRLIISEGYDTQGIIDIDKKSINPIEHARFRRMAKSVPLKERLSAELHGAILYSIEHQLALEGIEDLSI